MRDLTWCKREEDNKENLKEIRLKRHQKKNNEFNDGWFFAEVDKPPSHGLE